MFSGFRECLARRNPLGIIWIKATIVAKIHITHLGGFMIKLKKLSAIALAAVMAASALTGCGSKKDKSTVTTTPTDLSDEQPTTVDTSKETSSDTKDDSNSEKSFGLTQKTADGTILQCFSWSFNTIKDSLEDIALAGYSTIQTSPVNACYNGGDAGIDLNGSGKWYYHYQPTDWTIGNYQLGTKEEFKSMCEEADKYGIKVIVDVVPNHTTKSTEALGEGLLNAVGGIDNLYHKKGKDEVSNYKDRGECTHQAVGGLFDVNTENIAFQNYFINYMNECIACGADGFRFDTAKHIGLPDDPVEDSSMPNTFWTNVLSKLDNKDNLFIYGEVLQDGGDRIADYIDTLGAATASSYGYTVRGALQTGNLDVRNLTNYGIGNAKPNIVTWVESHDNYTGDDATYSKITNEDIVLGWTVLAAQKTGTPLFFSRPYNASSDLMWGTFNKIGMSGDYLYKNSAITAANRFRNAMAGEEQNIFNPSDSTSVIFIERGKKGLAIVNASIKPYEFNVETNLADGEYKDRVSGNTYTVKDGKISGTIENKSTIILYNDGYLELAPAAIVKVDDSVTGSYNTDSIEVKLHVENATEGEYSVDGASPVAYKDNDTITIGAGKSSQETTTLKLTAVNEAGNKTAMTYIFRKQATLTGSIEVTFVKPDSWGDKVYAYVYDETTEAPTVIENAAWPGVEMEHVEGNKYRYTFEKNWEGYEPLIIFNDSNNQSNEAMEPGENVINGKEYTCN